jgi:hypothetical protein
LVWFSINFSCLLADKAKNRVETVRAEVAPKMKKLAMILQSSLSRPKTRMLRALQELKPVLRFSLL